MQFRNIECQYGEFTIFQMHDHEESFIHILTDWNLYWENIVSNTIPNKGVAVQAGGHQGLYAVLLSKVFRQVYTFEPDNNNFLCLTKNCFKHKAFNVYKYECALGATSGSTTFQITETTGQHRINHDDVVNHLDEFQNPSSTFLVEKPIITIDSLNLKACDLLFFDLEGYEPYALIGSLETIKKYRPVIFVENYMRRDQHLNSILDMLINLYGYQYYTDIEIPNNRVLKYYEP